MDKRVLFYSQKCQPCAKLMSMIEYHELNNLFVKINVDTVTNPLPPFVDRVPLLVDNKTIIVDNELFQYVQNLCTSSSSSSTSGIPKQNDRPVTTPGNTPQSMPQNEMNGSLESFSLAASKNLSDTFSFLDGSSCQLNDSCQYQYLDTSSNQPSQQESRGFPSQPMNNDSNRTIDRLLTEREEELRNIMPNKR